MVCDQQNFYIRINLAFSIFCISFSGPFRNPWLWVSSLWIPASSKDGQPYSLDKSRQTGSSPGNVQHEILHLPFSLHAHVSCLSTRWNTSISCNGMTVSVLNFGTLMIISRFFEFMQGTSCSQLIPSMDIFLALAL